MKKQAHDPEVKENVIRLMKAQGLNMRTTAMAAGLGFTAVRDILVGRSADPRYSTVRAIAGVLKCQMTDIIPDDPAHLPIPSPSAASHNEDAKNDCIPADVVERALTACYELISAQRPDLGVDKFAYYTLRICRWIVSEQRRTGTTDIPDLVELRRIISFAITDAP